MLRSTVKAGEITHLTDARYFAAWEVKYLGFPLGSGGVSGTELAAIREWVEGPEIVGELVPGSPEYTPAAVAELGLDLLQFGGLAEVAEMALYREVTGIPLLIEYVVQPYLPAKEITDFLAERSPLEATFILNFNKGGLHWTDIEAGYPFTLAQLAEWTTNFPCLIEIDGALPKDIEAVLPNLRGFSVRGGAEEKVGFKDFDELDLFFEDLEIE